MGETDIIKYLVKKRGNPATLLELSCKLGVNKTNVARACRNLAERKEIKIKKQKQGQYLRHMISL
jgi:predicted transcriptional regulator